MKRSLQHVVFCDCLLLSRVFLRSIRAAAWSSTSFLFKALVDSFISWWAFGCFSFLAFMNNTAVDIPVQVAV